MEALVIVPVGGFFKTCSFVQDGGSKLCALDLGLRTASVAWSAPGENGGSPVVGYLAEAREHSSRRTRARAHCGPDAREATFEGGLLDCGSDSAK